MKRTRQYSRAIDSDEPVVSVRGALLTPRARMTAIIGTLLCVATVSAAQEVHGSLRRADGSTPASGAIIEVRRVPDGALVSRTIADFAGRFRLGTTSDSVVVRVLRLGWRPVVLDTVRLAAGASRLLEVTLPELPVELAPVVSTSDGTCQQYGNASLAVATLYAEIRTALLASQLYVPDGVPRSRFRLSTIDWSANERMLLEERHRDYRADSLRPFRSLPPRVLLDKGFVTYDRQGTGTFRAIDAEVLTSDEFLERYCFELVRADSARPGWVGIGFAPMRRNRSIVQVRGTIWVSGSPPVLERIEFSYVGLDQVSEAGRPGGWIEYSGVDDGHWFASRWQLRIPKLGAASVVRRRDMRVTELRELQEIRVIRGEVLELSMGGRIAFSAGATDYVDDRGRLVEDSTSRGPLRDVCAPSSTRAMIAGSVGDSAGRPLANARLRVTWRARIPGENVELTGVSSPEGHFSLCDVPSDRTLRLQIEADGFEGAALVVRASDTRSRVQLDLRLFRAPSPP